MKTVFKLVAVLPLCLLTACISIGGGGSKDDAKTSTYTLQPRDAVASAAPRGAAAVVVPKPDMPPGLSTDRIALIFGQGQMDYYSGAKWSAPLDDLLQNFVIQTARHDLPGIVVTTPDQGASPRYRLALKIADFEPVYPGDPTTVPQLKVVMTVTVVALPSGATRTQFTVEKTAAAGANTQTEVTKGLEKLLQAAADEALQKAAPSLRGS